MLTGSRHLGERLSVACMANLYAICFPACDGYAGQRMEAVVDWITILGVILGFAAGWLVGWRLKPQGALPVWISLYFSMGWLGNIMR